MVHTRHSYVKDIIEDTKDNDEDGKNEVKIEELKRHTEENETQSQNNCDDDDDTDTVVGDNNDDSKNEEKNDNKNAIDEEKIESSKEPRKRKRRTSMLESYDTLNDTLYRRSLRTRARNRYMDHYSGNHYGSRRLGSSKIRRSGRQKKKVFDTFNESKIQREIEKTAQEVDAASMYDSIKRRRVNSNDDSDEDEDEDESEEEEEEEEEDNEGDHPSYNLRKEKRQTSRYQPPLPSSRPRRREVMFQMHSPIHESRKIDRIPQHSSSPHKRRRRRRRTSSTSSSDDEEAFERRKTKSMNQARSRCLPMNFGTKDMVGVLKDRERAREMNTGSSLADVDPMSIDSKISFEDVGGLDHHIRALKEMVVFPLLYPEVFEKFSISPPRGVLFYGPPGTGKTLVARALANECSRKGQKVAFFMRKGADCLSKWVGESERQLRLLFDQAYTMRPSIIFFDEIDGIAPVRSTRQDQIHSSIVSTLLALMDGLDARGEIVIIGATNRLDSIDPALRRPGRFDREFLFGLPNRMARQKIIQINTSQWQPKLSKAFTLQLADKCVGYCGADLRALCTEAALFALRRRYPQIYKTSKKLVLDTDKIKISSVDFKNALKSITPASSRANVSPGAALPEHLKPLLGAYIEKVTEIVMKIFPAGRKIQEYDAEYEQEGSDTESQSIYEKPKSRQRDSSSKDVNFFKATADNIHSNVTHRPRILLAGSSGNGQTCYIAPSLLYSMEHLSAYVIDLPALFGTSTRTPEEAVAQIFREARRTSPSIIYLPHLDSWWTSISETTQATFVTLLMDIPSDLPVLVISTSNSNLSELPEEIQDLFSPDHHEVFNVDSPTTEQRREFFKETILELATQKPSMEKQTQQKKRNLEILPEASPVKQRELSAEEMKKLFEGEEIILRELRLYLRGVTWKLLADRKYKEFIKPVDPGEVDDYLQVIKNPMDLSTAMTRINAHHYNCCAHYLQDIDLITNNCLEYNPDRDQYDKLLRNRACELRDVAYQLVNDDLDPEFEKKCIEIHERRKNIAPGQYGKSAPSFLKVLPKHSNSEANETLKAVPIPDPTGSRFSRRVRGMNDGVLFDPSVLALVERRKSGFRVQKNSENESKSPFKNDSFEQPNDEDVDNEDVRDDVEANNRCELEEKEEIGEKIQDEEEKTSDGDPVHRVKRSLEFTKSDGGKSAAETAEEFLSDLVSHTATSNIQDLERIYSSLCRCLSENLNESDRCKVINELRHIVMPC